jgi:hypothetical protein
MFLQVFLRSTAHLEGAASRYNIWRRANLARLGDCGVNFESTERTIIQLGIPVDSPSPKFRQKRAAVVALLGRDSCTILSSSRLGKKTNHIAC